MSNDPPSRKMPPKDRRAPPGAKTKAGSLRHLKGLLGRPMVLQRQGGRLQVALVERRRAPSPDQPPPLSQVCAELRALLLAQDAVATQTMRHLVLVHDALGSQGWPAVKALSRSIQRKALVQAEMLASVEPLPALDAIIEQLRLLAGSADKTEASAARPHDFEVGQTLEVSETTYAEYEDMERGWTGTVPSMLT
jgi:hypothetical protein